MVMHNSFATILLKGITFLGSFLGLFLVSIFLLLFYKNKKDLWELYIVSILSVLLNNLLKWIIARPRPPLIHLVAEKTLSFPSGHAMASFTFYGYLIILIWESKWKKAWKIASTCFLSLLILAIGYSRIYLNVHYVSDVIAGYLIAFLFLCYFRKRLRNFLTKKKT